MFECIILSYILVVEEEHDATTHKVGEESNESAYEYTIRFYFDRECHLYNQVAILIESEYHNHCGEEVLSILWTALAYDHSNH